MPFSYHSHSGQFCQHGHGQLEAVVQEAIRVGCQVYGLTEHMPRYSEAQLYPEEAQAGWDCRRLLDQFDAYVQEARRLREKYRTHITVLVGMETEWFGDGLDEERVRQLQTRHQLDFIVGSVHHLRQIPIDYSPALVHDIEQTFQPQPAENYNTDLPPQHGTEEQMFLAYFDAQFDMLTALRPHVIGHFDLIRLFRPGVTTLTPRVKSAVERNVRVAVAYGGLFEVNTRAWKKGLATAYPFPDIMQIILSMGGRLTVCDDAHGPADVGMHYDRLRDYLQAQSVKHIHYLDRCDGDHGTGADKQTIVKSLSIADWLTHPFWKLWSPKA